MKPSNKLKIAALMLSLCLLSPAGAAFADNDSSSPGATALERLTNAGNEAGYDTSEGGRDVPAMVGNLIYQALALIGILLVCLVIYAGFLWATAQGNTEQITKAKQILINAIIGIIIVFAAYAITYFVVEQIATATLGEGDSST